MLLIAEAMARAGGGEGFSGGGGGGSDWGGGGGDGDGLGILIWLVFQHPVIGVPVLIVVAIVAIRSKSQPAERRTFRTHHPAPPPANMSGLHQLDPHFSLPLFLDLARLVYVRAHEERGRKDAGALRPFFVPETLERFMAEGRAASHVILGTTRVIGASSTGAVASLGVRFEANLVEDGRHWLVHERWTFRRPAATPSPGPDRMRTLSCPSCGSPADTHPDGRCTRCDTVLTDGRLTWQVAAAEVLDRAEVPRLALEPFHGVEAGTRTPTVSSADLGTQMRSFQARHPAEGWPVLRQRAVDVFTRIQAAWSAGDLAALRPRETDFLFQQHRYWLDRYRAEGLRNRVEEVRVGEVVPVRLTMDAWIEALTVRVYAQVRDWTEDASGGVVGGSRDRDRVFSEYWTFVRTAGATSKAADLDHCPSCGAPLDRVGESGVCGYCEAKVTGGDYDWVLSGIDQDEAYGG